MGRLQAKIIYTARRRPSPLGITYKQGRNQRELRGAETPLLSQVEVEKKDNKF